MARTAHIDRSTAETKIELNLNIDGTGKSDVKTGVDFFDHMLTLLTRHALFDLDVDAEGDLGVDAHHTVEDTGICLGQAIAQAAGTKKGITRYGSIMLPMDESLALVAVDLSGRACLEWDAVIPGEKCGSFDTCLGKEFMRALVLNAGITMHVKLLSAQDPHHALEAIFKGVGRALRMAFTPDPRETGIPSSKGTLI